MGSTIIEHDFPHDIVHRGQKDANRHNKRVDDAVRKQLKDIISQQDIITNEGNKRVKVRVKYLDQYRFRYNTDRIDDVGRDTFDELDDGEVINKPGGGGGRPAKAGDTRGEELYETEYTLDELTDMMIEELELPDLDDNKKNEIVSDVLEYTDRRKRVGIQSCLDKKQTLLAYLKRKTIAKDAEIDQDDLRFKTWEITTEKHSNAVVFLMMDRSASMWQSKIYAVKALYFWVVRFLKRKYDKVEIKFIAHDYYAKEYSEKEFFSVADSGGTRISAAYELCEDMIKHNYSSDVWNIYCFHASDGDTWGDEEKDCLKLIENIFEFGAKFFGYTEINMDNYREGSSQFFDMLKHAAKSNKKCRRLMVSSMTDLDEVMPILTKFLKRHVSSGV